MKKLSFVKPNLFLPDDIVIVGSSKILLKKKYGIKINEANFVVRFNFPTILGFEEFVGSQTSLMVINNHVYQSFIRDGKKNDESKNCLVISPYVENKDVNRPNLFFFEKKINQFFLALRFVKSFDIFIVLIKILIKKNFSIGFCFILLCVSSDINLKIFGFDLDENMEKRDHYYQKLPIGGRHDLVLEHLVLKKLDKNKQIFNIN